MNMLFYLEVSQLSQWKVSDIPVDINGLQDIVCAHVHAQLLQSCPTLRSVDCSLPSSFVHGFLQARILEWVDMPSSRRSSWLRDQTHISCIEGRFFTHCATWEALQDISSPQSFCDVPEDKWHKGRDEALLVDCDIGGRVLGEGLRQKYLPGILSSDEWLAPIPWLLLGVIGCGKSSKSWPRTISVRIINWCVPQCWWRSFKASFENPQR